MPHAPYFKQLADRYSISDNVHQAVIGGTGANHVMFGTGDMYFFSDGKGNPTPAPTAIPAAAAGLPKSLGTVSLVANPNPVIGEQSLASLQAAHAAPRLTAQTLETRTGTNLPASFELAGDADRALCPVGVTFWGSGLTVWR
jgi:phospholipase C